MPAYFLKHHLKVVVAAKAETEIKLKNNTAIFFIKTLKCILLNEYRNLHKF